MKAEIAFMLSAVHSPVGCNAKQSKAKLYPCMQSNQLSSGLFSLLVPFAGVLLSGMCFFMIQFAV